MSDDNDALLGMLLDDRVRGLNYFDIEAKHGIPAAEAKSMVNEALAEAASKDPIEMRYVVQLRLEKIVENLWQGLEQGSFKHAEAIIKSIERLTDLMDLNQATIKHQITIISDEETKQFLAVLKANNQKLYEKVEKLPLGKKAAAELESWPEWAAEAATEAVEKVIYAEEVYE